MNPSSMRVVTGNCRALVNSALVLMTARCEGGYKVPEFFDATQLLPPPPTDEAARRDLDAVRAAQKSRTPKQVAEAEASIAIDAFLFGSVLGPAFTPTRVPRTAEFLTRVSRSSLPYLQATKNRWKRLRPFVIDPTIAPLERSLASARLSSAPAPVSKGPLPPQVGSPCTAPAADSSYAPSYPSGHALVGAILAILLAELVPERGAELCAFGREYGDARVRGGVHFPSDVEAGRILAGLLVEGMRRDKRFCADLRTARQELRQALGYELHGGRTVPTHS